MNFKIKTYKKRQYVDSVCFTFSLSIDKSNRPTNKRAIWLACILVFEKLLSFKIINNNCVREVCLVMFILDLGCLYYTLLHFSLNGAKRDGYEYSF